MFAGYLLKVLVSPKIDDYKTYESDSSITLRRDDEQCPLNNLRFSGSMMA